MSNETLGASFSIDTTNLKAGLAQANRLIRESESEFKAAAAGLDDWSKSEDGLNSRIKSLNDITEIQRKKVDALQSEYDRLIADGLDPTSKQAVELRTKINNETAALNKNEAELKNQTQALEELEQSTEDAGNATDEAAGKFEGLKAVGGAVAGAVAAVGAACVGAIGSFLSLAESTREARTNMAKLETGFTTAGHSAEDATKTYTKLYGILGDDGQATEAAAHLAQLTDNQEDLATWTDIATGVYATFGDSLPIEGLTEAANETAKVGQVTGPLADALNWAGVSEDKFNESLEKCSTEQERQALITDTLNGLYSEAADKYKEVNADVIASQEAQANLNNTLNELGAIAEPIMTTLKTLANDLLQSITPFVSLIGEGLTGALEGADGATDTLAEGLNGLITSFLDKIIEVAPTVIETVVALFPKLLEAVLAQLPSIIETLLTMTNEVIVALAKMLPTIIPTIIDTVILVAETLINNVDMIIDAGIALLIGLADGLIEALPRLIEKIPVIISALLTAITNNLPKLLETGITLLVKLAAGLIQAIPQLLATIPQIMKSLLSAITNFLSNMASTGAKLLTNLASGLVDAIPKLTAKAPTVIKKLVNSILDKVSSLSSAGAKLLTNLASGLVDAIPKLTAKIPQVITAMTTALKNGFSKMSAVGQNLVDGIWQGISNSYTWIKNKITGWVGNVTAFIKRLFGINSPSKVMADEVGKNLALGIGVGFEDNIGAVNDEIASAMNFEDASINVNARKNGIGSGGGVTVYQTNNYSQAHSRYELYKSKQQTAAAVRLAMVGG